MYSKLFKILFFLALAVIVSYPGNGLAFKS